MKNTTTILSQLLQLLPENEFESFVGQHHADRYIKTFSCRNQLAVLLYAQATGKDSLREIELGLRILDSTWYHLGLTSISRSTIAYANAHRPWPIYQSLFYALLKKCSGLVFGDSQFSFDNPLYAIDSTTIDLCLSLFPWAHFRQEKGALKLHTLFNIRSQIPEVIDITDGLVGDITAAKGMDISILPKKSIITFDRGYNDYAFLWKINEAEKYFVIRLKKDAHIIHCSDYQEPVGKGVLKDERVAFCLDDAQEKYPEDLRLITYYDVDHAITYQFLTNNFLLPAVTIALVYKYRWQIELFFKWIKQHLKIKTFLGTSKNAVLTQIWIAMIYYLLLSWIKFQTKFKGSLLDLTRIIAEVILRTVHLIDTLSLTPKTIHRIRMRDSPQLALF